MNGRSGLRVGVGTAVLAVLVAACGSGSSGGSSGSSSSDKSSARGITDNSITIGGIVSLTSPAGAPFPGADLGAKARFARANADGGVNGRMINFVGVKDDGLDANRDLSLAKQLVLQNHVFAIVPATSGQFLPQTSGYLNSQHVPYMGWGFMPGFCNQPYGFGVNGCLANPDGKNNSLAGPVFSGLGLKAGDTFAIQGDTGDEYGLKEAEAAYEHFGMKEVYKKADLPATTLTNFTPYAQKIMTSNNGKPPTVVDIQSVNSGDTIGLGAELTSQGFKGAIVNNSTYTPDTLSSDKTLAAQLAGVDVVNQFLPAEAGGPAIDQMQQDLKTIGSDAAISNGISIGYWSADVFLQMLQAAGRNLTPESFAAAMNKSFSYKPPFTPFGVGPVSFPRDKNEPTPCGSMVQVQGTKYVLKSPMKCYF